MGLGVALISFSPNTTIKSADVNTNFTNLNNASTFNGTLSGTFNGQLSADGGLITSDGSGDLSVPSTGHYRIGAFNILFSPSTGDIFLNCPNAGGGHKCYIQVGGTNVFSIDINGNARTLGSLTQNVTP